MRLSFLSRLAGAAALLMAAVVALPATAAPTVVKSGIVASAILDFDVGGTLYDVTWVARASEPLFQGDQAGAQAAAVAIGNLLTNEGVFFVALQGVGSINNFGVQYAGVTTVTMGSNSNAPWFLLSSALNNGSVTVFTPVAEPASMAIIASGLIGIAAIRRRRRG